jgi:hypothetical protein
MPDHDVLRFATDLSAKLATRSRHVGAFLGAGAARACGLPDVTGLQAEILDRLGDDDERVMRALLENNRNLEQVLGRLRRIAALVSGAETVDGLTADAAGDLDRDVCAHIVTALDVGGVTLKPMLQFASWATRANYHTPVELFTVNYDLVIETALEEIRALYFDGFVGALKALSNRAGRAVARRGAGARPRHVRAAVEAARLGELGMDGGRGDRPAGPPGDHWAGSGDLPIGHQVRGVTPGAVRGASGPPSPRAEPTGDVDVDQRLLVRR